MLNLKLVVSSGTRRLPASLIVPTGVLRAAVIAMNPMDDQSKDQILLRHLTQTLPPLGIAVLHFDRRPKRHGWNVSLADQSEEALDAIPEIARRVGNPFLPVGVWGWDQGALAATVAAARSKLVKFLILVGCPGVSPAEQMRFGTAQHLRRAGFGEEDQADLMELRLTFESAVRGTISRAAAQKIVNYYVSRPWFPIACVPKRIQPRLIWPDMDFDPRSIFGQVVVPTLLFYGETDEWSPIHQSLGSWKVGQQASHNQDITIVRPRGTAHAPTIGSGLSVRAISPDYTYAMVDWLRGLCARFGPIPPPVTPAIPQNSAIRTAVQPPAETAPRHIMTPLSSKFAPE
jgi:uncharacterized protein